MYFTGSIKKGIRSFKSQPMMNGVNRRQIDLNRNFRS